jgi:hypothetical protein
LAASAPVALLQFSGLHAEEPQAAVLRALGDRAAVVKPTELAGIRPHVVVSGTVQRREKGYAIDVTVSGANAQPIGHVTLPFAAGRHLSAAQLVELGRQVEELTTSAMNAPAPTSPAPARQATDSEAAPIPEPLETSQPMVIGLHRPARQSVAHAQPPLLYPWIEGSIGAIVDTRWLKLSPAVPPSYNPGTGGGLHADVTVYPLAWSQGLRNGLFAGLGGFITLELPFWPTTEFVSSPNQYDTRELRIEGGARWRFIVRRRSPRIEVAALLGEGLHSFSIAKAVDASGAKVDAGPPDVAYVYALFGVSARVFLWNERLAPWLSFQYEYVPDAGPVEDASEYGLATTNGVVARGGLDVYVWQRLRVGASAFWERMMSSFTTDASTKKHADYMIDQYYGGVFTAGYDY